MKNAFSIDLEDWFCVRNLRAAIPFHQWDACELRIERSMDILLELLDKKSVKCTVFVLGYIAQRAPSLIARIRSAGHEIATHGFAHLMVKESTPQDFEHDLLQSLDAIERACGVRPRGYRAPSFSLLPGGKDIFDILVKSGIRYDSSLFPVSFHPEYGFLQRMPLGPHEIAPGLEEFPLSCFKVMGVNLPCCGGGYFRILPFAFTSHGISKCNREGRPVVFYLHPWEVDPAQPRVRLTPLKAFRHYFHLDKTQARLNRLLDMFEFDAIESVLGLEANCAGRERRTAAVKNDSAGAH